MDRVPKKVKCNEGAEVVMNNIDLLTMILLNIPVICLLRLKLTCRGWFTLISDKIFCDEHTKRHFASRTVRALYGACRPIVNFSKQPHQLINNGLPTLRFLFSNADGNGLRRSILASTNGLMLCEKNQTLFVFNPTTQMCREIGPSVFSRWYVGHHLCFYPSISNFYKVIRITTVYVDRSASFQIEIYSSTTRLWNETTMYGPYKLDKNVREVLCNGVIYWLTKTKTLLMFHVDEEVMTSTISPVLPLLGKNVLWSGEVSGSLFVVDTEFRNSTMVRIFRLDWDTPRWTVVLYIDMLPIVDTIPPLPHGIRTRPKVLCLKENAQEIPMVIFVISKRMILYNTMNDTYDIIRDMSQDNEDGLPTNVGAVHTWDDNYKFIDSLAHV